MADVGGPCPGEYRYEFKNSDGNDEKWCNKECPHENGMRSELNIVTMVKYCVCDDPDWKYNFVSGKCIGGPERHCVANG